MFLIVIITVFVAQVSCLATMIWAVDLPPDRYTSLENRWLNWPEKECYTKENIELLIEGPPGQKYLSNYEQNEKTYIASIQSKLIRFTR
tara:strand:- start:913 stop:1179 length:267 start_codon:yes stop_codon:yes gene_type:complete